jgi:hypothetical protein
MELLPPPGFTTLVLQTAQPRKRLQTLELSAGLMDEVTDEFELIGIQTSRGFSKPVNSRHWA